MSQLYKINALMLCALSIMVTGCSDEPELAAKPAESAQVLTPELQQGKAIWSETCQVCHKPGLAGAPKIGDKTAWQPRIAQGMDTLFNHAIHGFLGKAGTEMPAKGGNAALTDEQVKLAVRYMVSQSQ